MQKITDRQWRIYKQTAEKEPTITEDVEKITKDNGMELFGLDTRLKTPSSLYEKMRERGSIADIKEMKDIVRYTGVTSRDKLTQSTLACFSDFKRKGYKILEVKNTWVDKNAIYKGIGVFFVSPNGLIFEMQFHTAESYRAKSKMHSLYEIRRTLSDDDPQAKEFDEKMRRYSVSLKPPKNINRIRNK